jgi:hypothetical protein
MSDNSLTLLKTLYYRITQPDNQRETNAAIIDFIPFIDKQSTYSGLENRFMMDVNGVPNNDIICFIGYRTPSTALGIYSIYSLYNETNTIYGERESIISSIQINPGTSILLKCNNPPNYVSKTNINLNDYQIPIPAGNYRV